MQLKVSDQDINNAIDEFLKRLNLKLEQKGNLTFNSIIEVLGKATEEYYELVRAVHLKDNENACTELLDLMIVGLWGLISIRKNEENNK